MIKTDEPVIVKVPATSANCGPGFDCLGVACTLYNTFTYEVIKSGLELLIDGEGHGVGLFLVKEKLATIGGKISVESDILDGTIFTVEIPIKEGAKTWESF